MGCSVSHFNIFIHCGGTKLESDSIHWPQKDYTRHYTLTTTMTPAFRWAVVLAVLTFSFTEEEQRQNRTASMSHERLYLMLHCHPHIDFCMQIGSIVGCFKVFIHCGGTKLKSDCVQEPQRKRRAKVRKKTDVVSLPASCLTLSHFQKVGKYPWQELPQVSFLSHVCHDKTCLLLRRKYAYCNKTFVVTKLFLLWQNFCCDKYVFLMTKMFCHDFCHDRRHVLSWQTCKYVMTKLLSQQIYACRNQSFVTTKSYLSWQKKNS